jgi:hypothetical protein
VTRRFAAIGAAFSVLGCSTSGPITVTQSNKDADYRKKLRRVVMAIVVHSDKLTKVQNQTLLQPDELKRSFQAKWPPLGLSVEIVDLDGIADQESAVALAASRLQATQWLRLQTTSVLTEYDAIKSYSMDASLYDAGTRQRIWRAQTQFPDFWRSSGKDLAVKLGRQNAADAYVDDLTARLRADGLL